MGVRALWWLQHYVQQVRPQLLVNPHCNALFVAMDGLAGLQANGITNAVGVYIRASGIVKWEPATCSATRWRRRCWRMARTCGGYRRCWAMPVLRVRRSTRR